MSERTHPAPDVPLSGAVPAGAGLPAVVRIPVPGTNGLAVELRPRGHVPKTGSTSTVFIQNLQGNRHLRLDYGFNKATQTFEWHWNQKGTHAQFGVGNHQSAGRAAGVAGEVARHYRYAGRALVVVGVALDAVSIVTASRPLRRTAQVVSAWTGAVLGCKGGGAAGAGIGAFFAGAGAAPGGIAGCAVGGFLGYLGGERVGGYLYDWAEGTVFTPLREVRAP